MPPQASGKNPAAPADQRDRFLRTMHFEAVDHPPLLVPGPWSQTRARWEREGLPADVDLDDYFELEPMQAQAVAIDTLIHPPVEVIVLEETDRFVVKINKRGVKVREFKDHESMPEYLDYPIKGPQSLPWIREKLDPHAPGRVDPQWLAKAEQARAEGSMLTCNGGTYFAFLNEHMGTERLALAYYDSPEFIHEVCERLCRLCEQALETCLPRMGLDFIGYHEDMAYRNGPLISPAMFREFMTPYYKRVTEITRRHHVDLHWMDSDGDIRKLIPLWLECGINIFYPIEVAAGMDAVALRAEYGRQIGMIGGFDKRILATDPRAIRAELERLRPVVEGGGYIPNCDHGVPSDVPFENVCCFVETLKSMYAMS